jgi:hypothetical protein
MRPTKILMCGESPPLWMRILSSSVQKGSIDTCRHEEALSINASGLLSLPLNRTISVVLARIAEGRARSSWQEGAKLKAIIMLAAAEIEDAGCLSYSGNCRPT